VTRFGELLRVLGVGGARFVLVGGVAATAHGSPRSTQDLDVVYRRDDENLRRIAAALCPHHPYMRGAPPGLPFRLDFETLRSGLNFTLTTDLGWIDLLGESRGWVVMRIIGVKITHRPQTCTPPIVGGVDCVSNQRWLRLLIFTPIVVRILRPSPSLSKSSESLAS
jgi:hypothetical protein